MVMIDWIIGLRSFTSPQRHFLAMASSWTEPILSTFTLVLALWLALSSWMWIRETVLRLGLKRYQIFSLPLSYLYHCLRGICSACLLGWGQWEKCGTPTSIDLQLKAEPFQLNCRSVRINNDCFKLLSLAWFVIQNYCGNR